MVSSSGFLCAFGLQQQIGVSLIRRRRPRKMPERAKIRRPVAALAQPQHHQVGGLRAHDQRGDARHQQAGELFERPMGDEEIAMLMALAVTGRRRRSPSAPAT